MTQASSWRDHSREVIDQITRDMGITDPDALEKAIRAAYPFGERAHWPYRVFNEEVRRHMAIVRDLKRLGLPKDTGPLFQDALGFGNEAEAEESRRRCP